MTEMQSVSESDFQNEVLNASGPVLVDFSAVWCQPCKALDPLVKQLAAEWQGRVKVVKMDADQSPNILMQYGVLGIPTLLLFKDGQPVERLTGMQSRDKLISKLSPHF
jgi:thioredoxin 1